MNLNKIYLVILLLGWGGVTWGQDCFTLKFTDDDVEVMPSMDDVVSVCGETMVITVLGPLMMGQCQNVGSNIQYEWFVLNNMNNEVSIGSDSETLEITNTDYNGDEIFIRVTDLVDEDDEMDDVVFPVESFVVNIQDVTILELNPSPLSVCATIADFALNPSPLIEGGMITVEDSDGNMVSGAIDGANFLPSAVGEGTYTITYSVDENCYTAAAVEITVDSLTELSLINDATVCATIADFALNPSPLIEGGMITVEDSDGNMVSGAIDGANFLPSAVGEGTYTITYSVDENCYTAAAVEITVDGLTELSLIDDTEVCDDTDPVDLNPSPSGPDENFVVTFTGTGMSNAENVIQGNEFSPEEAIPGRYSITYTQSGCIIPAMVDITVNSLPDISAATDFDICQGADRDLGVSITDSVGVYGYAWNNGGFLDNPQIPNPTLSSNLPVGETTFSVAVTDDNDCSSTEEQTVNVVAQPMVEIVELEPACNGEVATLRALLEGGVEGEESYSWNIENQTEIDIMTDTLFVGVPLPYSVSVTYPDETGCSTAIDVSSFQARQTPAPKITLLGDNTNICENQLSIFLIENGSSLTSIRWMSDVLENTQDYDDSEVVTVQWGNTNTAQGFIKVREFYPGTGGCAGEDEIQLTFSGDTVPDPAIIFRSAVNDILVYNDDTACSYQWGYYEETNNGIILMELPEEIFQSYVPDPYVENRTYWCIASYEATNGDCASSCSTLAIAKSGSNEEPVDALPPFLMYPNPTSSRLNVEINRLIPDAIYDLRIFNTLGQLVKTMELRAKGGNLTEEIDVSTRQEGVYHLTLVREGRFLATWPFVIQR